MSDVLDVLRGLRVGPDGAPASIERLRERNASRRRRRRRRGALGGGLSLAVIAAAVLLVVVDDEGGSTLRTVDDPTTVPSVGPDVTSPLPIGSVVSSASGIEQVAESGALVLLSDQPAARAFAIGDLVVRQGAEVGDVYPMRAQGPVLVLDAGDQRTLSGEAGEELMLHDVGMVDGRAVAVVTAGAAVAPKTPTSDCCWSTSRPTIAAIWAVWAGGSPVSAKPDSCGTGS